ncbi:mechanosensitive ion channel family protein [Candidatus Synechococcus calcipolaris G9]|uniref:Mechanosensitive ion channel family protein n=1 Tax=Candidatus Synechococcus calcipolaris G9 TaxID=1497997 RepID=A0ABT6F0Z0_9SYNE|nr:mechanosensitive ion channel family protein [Candidatus Synechococcus calcipolaris]MDG2991518.1 mechanosensitive ion channel family protein [Candidatus Synechococcus calcipolaris G9]
MKSTKFLRFVLILFLSCLLVLSWRSPALSQFSVPNLSQVNVVPPPPNISRAGRLEAVQITFDGEPLFMIASELVRDRSNPGDLMPVEMRAELIEAGLQRVVKLVMERHEGGGIPPFQVVVAQLNHETIILAQSPLFRRTGTILTVTEADASYNGTTIEKLAEEWREILERHLTQALEERTPEAFIEQLRNAFITLAVMAAILMGLIFLDRLVKRLNRTVQERLLHLQEEHLREEVTTTEVQMMADPSQQMNFPAQALAFLDYRRSLFITEQEYKLFSALSYLLFWAKAWLVIASFGFIFAEFPTTRDFAQKSLDLPIVWIIMWFITGVVSKIADFGIDWLGRVTERNDIFNGIDIHRKSLRISTTTQVMRGVKTSVIYLFRGTYIMTTLGVPITSVLALGGLLALALSFGSQSLVKDIINGLLIISEDQYAIGDVVMIDDFGGAVETMNLRITQLRNGEGMLITIPNGTITKVANLTRTWSRVNFEIVVDYESDAEKALEVLRQVVREMYDEPEWNSRIIAPPEVLGIDEMTHGGMLVRIWIQTKPIQQWAVARELRLRVRLALEKHNISIGRPHQVLSMNSFHANNHSDYISGLNETPGTVGSVIQKPRIDGRTS